MRGIILSHNGDLSDCGHCCLYIGQERYVGKKYRGCFK